MYRATCAECEGYLLHAKPAPSRHKGAHHFHHTQRAANVLIASGITISRPARKSLRGRRHSCRCERLLQAPTLPTTLPPAMHQSPPHTTREVGTRREREHMIKGAVEYMHGFALQSVRRKPSNPPRAPTHACTDGVMQMLVRRREIRSRRRCWLRAT